MRVRFFSVVILLCLVLSACESAGETPTLYPSDSDQSMSSASPGSTADETPDVPMHDDVATPEETISPVSADGNITTSEDLPFPLGNAINSPSFTGSA